jgi:hypothetical protein
MAKTGIVPASRMAMSEHPRLRYWQYVNRPLDQVQALLRNETLELIQRATMSAAMRTKDLLGKLLVQIGSVSIAADIRARVDRISDESPLPGLPPMTSVELHWEAASTPALFPLMSARLSVWQISSTETLVEIEGSYKPPLGVFGAAFDAVLGRRIAEASVQRFLQDVSSEIERPAHG